MVKTFGEFAFDDHRRKLKSGAHTVRLSGQAVELLCLLLERPGELVTREEIERRLWPDRSVGFNHSVDVVVSRLRTAFGDKGANPRYIETVPRKGYRFIKPVATRGPAVQTPVHWSRPVLTYAAIALLAAVLAILFVHTRYDKFVPSRGAQESSTVSAP